MTERAVIEALKWYEDHARYISEKLHGEKVTMQTAVAIEASLVALALDGGRRARAALALGEKDQSR